MLDSVRPFSERWCTAIAITLVVPSVAVAQVPAVEDGPATAFVDTVKSEALAESLLEWVSAVEQRAVPFDELVPIYPGEHPLYAAAIAAFAVDVPRSLRVTHAEMYARLLRAAENGFTPALCWPLLRAAAMADGERAFEPLVLQARDDALWTWLRAAPPPAWQWLRAHIADRSRAERMPHVAAAALRLLGEHGEAADHALVAGYLRTRDPRPRRAAAAALARLASAETYALVVERLGFEPHAMVRQELLVALQAALTSARPSPAQLVADLAPFLRGRDWRVSIAVVDLLAAHPCAEGVDALLLLMERQAGATGRRRVPLLQERVWRRLREITGANLPADDVRGWREFWQREGAQVRLRPAGPRAGVRRTRATMRDVPVMGRDVAFLLDASASMKKTVPDPADPAAAAVARLELAGRQIAAAVARLRKGTHYSLLTFTKTTTARFEETAGRRRGEREALTSFLAGLRAEGGSDILGGILHVLAAEAERADPDGLEELFVVSDGLPSGGEVVEPARILQIVRELNRGRRIRIHTVFAGTGAGEEFLRQLAAENDGEFVRM